MTVIGLDDTDSREGGMCTTYLAASLADRIRAEATVDRVLLVRLNPSVPYKTRGNAAVAIHTDLDPERAVTLAGAELESVARTDDPNTEPGLVVASGSAEAVPEPVRSFATAAMRELHAIDDATSLIERYGYRAEGWKGGRGRIGALAAIGAGDALDDWTYELIAYREAARWGTPREVDTASVFAAAETGYPAVWDTVDRTREETVCVPHTPCPVLYGIRGDDETAVRATAGAIESEPVAETQLFVTNQGTDVHLGDGEAGSISDGRAYRLTGDVVTGPETRRGGHVFLSIETGGTTFTCAAFEPTKHFRDDVRSLRPGDRITVCGEVTNGTLKLEKFAVRDLVRTERVTPTCQECGRTMESAGKGQGYRCRACDTSRPGKETRRVDRSLEGGWYEVPPCARRHIAKPLIRGGFDAPVHPQR